MTTGRTFGITFCLAVVLEALRWLSPASGASDAVFTFAGYAVIVALGILLARNGFGYAAAFANTWPFVLLWFAIGALNLLMAPSPAGWSGHDVEMAWWGYLIATLVFAPLAFASAALGVWLGRRLKPAGSVA